MDVLAYLDRIGFPGWPDRDLASLAALQRAHLGRVPFENLHVFHRRGVQVDLDWSVPKIVEQGRGGWCFELNGAFGALLRALGFDVTLLAATVLLGQEREENPDHLALLVRLDRPYLVDVGFGDSFTRPLALDDDAAAREDHGDYRVVDRGGPVELQLRPTGTDEWQGQYRFTLAPRELSDFETRSHFLQTEPGLHWTEGPFATRLLPGGRVTLLPTTLKVRRRGEVTETAVAEADWPSVLAEWFSMTP